MARAIRGVRGRAPVVLPVPPFTAPASDVFNTFGDTARPWPSIVARFGELAANDEDFADLSAFVSAIAASGFPEAGLSCVTSMHDLILGPSTHVLDNPHLRISYDFSNREFEFTYQDGSRKPWKRTVSSSEAMSALDRFLTRRARWFRRPSGR